MISQTPLKAYALKYPTFDTELWRLAYRLKPLKNTQSLGKQVVFCHKS